MWALLWTMVATTRSLFRTQRELALENLALRQQVATSICTRGARPLRLGMWDRAFWVMLSHRWTGWREALAIAEPATLVVRENMPQVHLVQHDDVVQTFPAKRSDKPLRVRVPEAREAQGPELGNVVGFPEIGGLHHRYAQVAA